MVSTRQKPEDCSAPEREIKQKHGLAPHFEVKWTKVSPATTELYFDLVDYFFDNDDLHFLALIVPNKSKLQHNAIPGQDHDIWYYKMYFDTLKVIFHPHACYRIYLDLKDTRGTEKTVKLHEVLCNNMYDFLRNIIERLQLVRSHEIEQLQLADLLVGAISYFNRNLHSSKVKEALIASMGEPAPGRTAHLFMV